VLPGRYLFVFMVMIWGINSVPAHAETIQVTIDKLVFSPVELNAKVGDTITWNGQSLSSNRVCFEGPLSVNFSKTAGPTRTTCLITHVLREALTTPSIF
jgi:plastocyanin